MASLKINNLSFSYSGCNVKSLDSVSLDIKDGEFCLLCGSTGSGKSTLLRLIKRELAPYGNMSGDIFLGDRAVSSLSEAESAALIGFVMQRPQNQPVTDKVWQELAFGLENLGLSQAVIRRRVAEIASFFGISEWFDSRVSELSGGQLQLLNIAAVTVMQPELLLLDEPTAQLDPVSAEEIITTVVKLNRELGITVIIAEHKLEEVIASADKMAVLDNGRLSAYASPAAVCASLPRSSSIYGALPCASQIFRGLDNTRDAVCPLTVSEGKRYIEEKLSGKRVRELEDSSSNHEKDETAIEAKRLFYSYGDDVYALSGAELTVYKGEIYCILGANASGKSTLLRILSGLLKPTSGYVKIENRNIKKYTDNELYNGLLAMLPQDVTSMFVYDTVREELASVPGTAALPFELSPFYDRHPYDLSGGEQQQLALAKLLLRNPRILLLDEPTKGLDAYGRKRTADILKKLKGDGKTVIAVTHDPEFAAICADRCGLFFNGELISSDTPRSFFSGNRFYTTAANRIAGKVCSGALTSGDVLLVAEEALNA